MKRQKLLYPLITFFIILFFGSCVPRSSYTLLYNMNPDSLYSVKYKELARVKPQDRLNIIVKAKNPALAIPFNTQEGYIIVGKPSLSVEEPSFGKNQNNSNNNNNNLVNNRITSGYVVDDEGNIIFPIIGKINVAGLSLMEISHKIENIIKKEGYIKEPLVDTQFLEFRVYIINGTGGTVINVPSDRFNIIQAIAQGISVDQQVRVDHVAVIRKDKNGDSRIYFNNLLNTDVFNSPTFYLQPGDIIYVQPKYQRANAVDLDNIFKYTSYIFTTVFTVTSILNIFNK